MAFSSASNSNKTILTTLNDSINSSLNASQSLLRSGSRNSAGGGGGGGEDLLPKLKTLVSLDDDWIAVKSLSQINVNTDNLYANKNDEIINIVSISVEKEKVNRILIIFFYFCVYELSSKDLYFLLLSFSYEICS
jgi:hypothetical protein